MMRVVVDTNVLVSAIIAPAGPPAQILDLILSRRLQVIISLPILAEYEEVLVREEFGFSRTAVRQVLGFLRQYGALVTPMPCSISLPDPDDLLFVDCALAGRADYLITGNKRHFPAAACRLARPISPSEFLRAFREI